MARLIVAGTRTIDSPHIIIPALDGAMAKMGLKWDDVECLLHGDSRGVDKVAGAYAAEKGIPVKKFRADWNGPLKKQAGPARNYEMACEGTHLIALWDGKSFGTKNMLAAANFKGLKIHAVKMDTSRLRSIRLGEHFPSWIKKEALALTLNGKEQVVTVQTHDDGTWHCSFNLTVEAKEQEDLLSGWGTPHGVVLPAVVGQWKPQKLFSVTLPPELTSEKYLRRCCGELFARMTDLKGEDVGDVNFAKYMFAGLPFSMTLGRQEMMQIERDSLLKAYREVAATLYGILSCLEDGRLQLDHVGHMPRTFINVFGSKPKEVLYRIPPTANHEEPAI